MKHCVPGPQATCEGPASPHAAIAALGIAPCHQLSICRVGYRKPTPIQVQAIPHILNGKDLLGCARTGTGKTAAFALPILQKLSRRDCGAGGQTGPRALILAPTRELAVQIGASFGKYGAGCGVRHLVVYGGVGKPAQARALRAGVDILVATPGRLLDLLDDGSADLGKVAIFVLDEADRMLDMGFVRDVRRIQNALPPVRQTLMFSATMPPQILALASKLLREPTRINADPVSSVGAPIAQSVFHVESNLKPRLLVQLLATDDIDRALVFTRTKHGANRLARRLLDAGFPTAAIHGNKSQRARTTALERFRAGGLRVVVATDVAARGIDIKNLSHVVNFDLPNDPESYVHRVGRTGRAGTRGTAVSFCSREERTYLREIEHLTHRRLKEAVVPKITSRPGDSPDHTAERPALARPHRRATCTSPSASAPAPTRWGGPHAGVCLDTATPRYGSPRMQRR